MNKIFVMISLFYCILGSLTAQDYLPGGTNTEGHLNDRKSVKKGEARVITPNIGSLEWIMDGDVKVFHLIAEPVKREFSQGFVVNCWGYNGLCPGPTIEAVEGDRIRILVTNNLPEPTTVHWHGLIIPNGMDGVAGLNQRTIKPGETFKYEFTLVQNGTFMYHPHADEMIQVGMGMGGFFIIHPKLAEDPPVDRDFAIFLQEWFVPVGGMTPDPTIMLDFNLFTFNGVLFPKIESLVAKKGDRVRIRFANISMDNHPIHLHGHEFTVIRRGAKRIPPSAQYTEVTVDVPVGATRDIEFIADNPGDWAFHCHKTHHTMNQMGHDLPNIIGINTHDLDQRIRKLFPGYKGLMGASGMGEMFEMMDDPKKGHGHSPTRTHTRTHDHVKASFNISPMGSPGPFGIIEMGGMFTVFKVRDGITNYNDPGWYKHPPGTTAENVDVKDKSLEKIQHMNH